MYQIWTFCNFAFLSYGQARDRRTDKQTNGRTWRNASCLVHRAGITLSRCFLVFIFVSSDYHNVVKCLTEARPSPSTVDGVWIQHSVVVPYTRRRSAGRPVDLHEPVRSLQAMSATRRWDTWSSAGCRCAADRGRVLPRARPASGGWCRRRLLRCWQRRSTQSRRAAGRYGSPRRRRSGCRPLPTSAPARRPTRQTACCSSYGSLQRPSTLLPNMAKFFNRPLMCKILQRLMDAVVYCVANYPKGFWTKFRLEERLPRLY